MSAAAPAGSMVPVATRIRQVVQETHDTYTIDLDNPMGSFEAGQFNMLYVFGKGEVAISMSGPPAAPDLLRHTVRSVGSVTDPLCRMAPGDVVGVRGPFGNPWPIDDLEGKDVVLVAGGIGLAPLRPAITELLRRREAYGHLTLLYGARTTGDLLYRRQLEEWQADGRMAVRVSVDRGDSTWRGHVGVVTTLFPAVGIDPARTVGLVCGPEIMMRFVAREFAKRGLPPTSLFLSIERNMKCAVGLCGHCQYGPHFVCKDGPVFRHDRIDWLLRHREI